MGVVSDLAVRQDIRSLAGNYNLDQVNRTPHLEVAQIQTSTKSDAAHLVISDLLLKQKVSL